MWKLRVQLRRTSADTTLAEFRLLLLVGYETANHIRDFIGGGVQREVPAIKDVNLCLGNIAAVRLGLAGVEYPPSAI